jgi:hypothetical protein
MWRLFRRKASTASPRGRPPERVPPFRYTRQEPPSFDGYSVEVLTPEDAIRSMRFDELTTEQLRRVLAANNTSVRALGSEGTIKAGDSLS